MYKHGFQILTILMIVFILAACSSLDTREFEMEENGVTITMTYYYDNDEVKKQTSENVIPYESLGVSSEDEAKELLDPEAEKFQDIEGVTEEIDYDDSEATETLEVEYDNVDPDELEDLPGTMTTGDIEKGISMEKTAEMLENQGFEEK